MFGRLAITAVCLVAVSANGFAGDAKRAPNFVIIFADDLGYGDLACFGSTAIRTPRLDRMAAEGMKFTSFYAQTVCGPSRTAIMTGCYPLRVAERGNVKNTHPIVHEKEITIAELLRPLGYATAMIGKWDLAKHVNRGFFTDLLPQGQGFDMHFGTPSSNDNWAQTVLLRNGKVIEAPIRQEISTTERYTDAAIEFITSNKSRPFFIYLCPNMPHTALHTSAMFRGKSKRGIYGDVVEELDHHVGRILDTLRTNGLEENTYVLFTSDNGPWLVKNRDHRQGIGVEDHGGSATPLRSGKTSTWEGGVRVPCIFWAPGRVAAGTVCDKVASTLDVLPTFAALAGTAKPDDRVIDGEDMRHLLAGQFDKAAEDKVFCYYFLTHLRAVRQGKWKLHLPRPERPPWLGHFSVNQHIHPSDDIAITHPMLFDLDADIGETVDVAGRYPDVVARLTEVAQAARADIGDYNRVGAGARFFDEGIHRPDAAKELSGNNLPQHVPLSKGGPQGVREKVVSYFRTVPKWKMHKPDRSGICPGWLPQDEVSPFFPDDAFTVKMAGRRQACVRKSFELNGKPKRAVLAVTNWHSVAVSINKNLVAEYYGQTPDRVPKFVDVTDQLRVGKNELDVRVWSEWMLALYFQLRIEMADGSFVDVISDDSWQWHQPSADHWPRGDAPEEGWKNVRVFDDYYGTMGRATKWDKEFALMPRAMLKERMTQFNDRLRASWAEDRSQVKPLFDEEYRQPEYAAQYEDFLKIDPESGNVVDATGRIRHLFFTIYGQELSGRTVLSLWDFDFDIVEHDLALMEAAAIHPNLRTVGWHDLLDAQGNWRRCEQQPRGTGLPQFRYNYEVLDYFLGRCQAHGRFVAIVCDFLWSAHWDTLPAPYHVRYYLYPEVVEANGLAHRKILSRYSERTCIAGFMVGEEEIRMAPDLDNAHLQRDWVSYLKKRYGTVSQLAAVWRHGYDFADHSQWIAAKRRASYWSGDAAENPLEEVLLPRYPLRPDAWSALRDWSQVALPIWPRYRWAEPPHAELESHRTYLTDTDDDPVWIDYNAFREDVLYLQFVSRWAELVRQAAPHQWLFHSNAEDYTSQWHFIHFFRRAKLPFSVIGVGSHDDGKNLSELSPWRRVRKYAKVIASYRPYVLAPESPAIGVASGEGAGGKPSDEQGILDYYRGQSMEMVGHGAAFELSYTWMHLSGAKTDPNGRAKMTKVLDWMGRFYREVDGVAFSLRRDVPVLVVRNNNLQRSNRSGREFGNALGLIGALSQTNIEFDVVMDQDLVYGSHKHKVDLGQYSVVFLPCVDCDYLEPLWQTVDRWLTDTQFRGRRSLVVGYVGNRSAYLTPHDRFHPTLARWLGMEDYAGKTLLRGSHDCEWKPLSDQRNHGRVRLNFGQRGDVCPSGVFSQGRPLLLTADGKPIAVSINYEGNSVHAFGFPLGFAYDLLWGIPAIQERYDTVPRIYDDILEVASVERSVHAPYNVRVAVSDDQSVVLIRELYGIETTDLCSLQLPAGIQYEGCETLRQEDGRTQLRANLPPYGGLCLKRKE